MNKYIAEFIGTMILVFFGTGTAVVTGGFTGGLGLGYLGVVAIALAFGLTIVNEIFFELSFSLALLYIMIFITQ